MLANPGDKVMANQFTKGTRKQHDEATKDKIRAELLAQRLFKFAKSKGKKREELDMSPAQVAASKVLIDRGKPALQSVEQTVKNEFDTMSDEEMRDMVRGLITANPWLLDEFKPGPKPDAAPQSTAAISESPELGVKTA